MAEEQEHQVYTPVTVSIDVDALINSRGFGYQHDEDGEVVPGSNKLTHLVVQAIAAQLAPELRKAVGEAVKEAALGQVDVIVSEVVEGTVRLTNSYGEPTGETTTLREQMVSAVKDRMNAKVSARDGSYLTGYNSRDGITLAQYIARSEADKALKGELREAAVAAVAETKAAVHKIVADELAAKVTQAVTRNI